MWTRDLKGSIDFYVNILGSLRTSASEEMVLGHASH